MKNNILRFSSLLNLAVNCKKHTTKIVLSLALALPFGIAQASVPAISVSGNKVLFGGQPGSVSGNSMFWSNNGWGGERFYNASAIGWLKTDFHSKLVRAAMGVNEAGGYIDDPAGNKARVKTVVDAAIANDMYVIIDFHSHVASNYQSQAIAFFKDMASTYGTKNNVIYELFNEPLNVSWTGTIKPYCTEVIQAIRQIDPDNLIICGTPNWSQDVDVASLSPITGYSNIAYTLHFYAGSHGQSLRSKAQTALNNGLPLFVTEWGSVNASGDGAVNYSETDAWVSFMKANNISNANWSLNDKAEGASLVVPGASSTGGWSSSQLTASGNNAKGIILGWPALNTGGGSGGITVNARGTNGREHINLKVGGSTVASWTLTTSYQNYVYSGGATGGILVEYDNDGVGGDVQVNYMLVNNETRQAEAMSYNTGLYANGSCGGGGYSEWMQCNGVIGFGYTYDCYSGNCSPVNKLTNGTFNTDMNGWTLSYGNGANASKGVQGGSAYVWISTAGTNVWDVQLFQNTTITQGKQYKIEFDARITEGSIRTIGVNIEKNASPWTWYGGTNFTLSTSWSHYSYTYSAVSTSDAQARLIFQLGTNSSDVNLDNITLTEL